VKIIRWVGPARRLGRRFFRYDEAVIDDDARRILLAQWHFHLDRKMLRRFPQYFDVGEIASYLEPFGIIIDGYAKPARLPPPPLPQVEIDPLPTGKAIIGLNYLPYFVGRCDTTDILISFENFDTFYTRRKPWKCITVGFLEDLIKRSGGEVVQGS
jgi:hypothetical protein